MADETNFLLYRIGLYVDGCHSLTGFLACVTYAFGIPAIAAKAIDKVRTGSADCAKPPRRCNLRGYLG